MKLILALLRIQQQLRIFHWQTRSYSEHKAFGKVYESLDESIDAFVEEFMGKYGRPEFEVDSCITLSNYGTESCLAVINGYVNFMVEEIPASIQHEDTNLLNIRDDMLGELNRLKYLLTLI